MKILVLTGLFFVLTQATIQSLGFGYIEIKENLAAMNDCIEEQGLHIYTKKIQHFLQTVLAPLDDPEFNNFFMCYWTKLELLDGYEDLNYDKITVHLEKILAGHSDLNLAPIVLAQTAVEKCRNFEGESSAERAIKTQNCIKLYLLEENIE